MDETLLHRVDALLGSKSDQDLKHLLLKHDARDVADIIDALSSGRRKTFALLPPETQADVIVLLSEGSKANVLVRLADTAIARMLHFLNEDDATDVLQVLPKKRHPVVLGKMKEDRRKKIEKLLAFGPETAGGLMDLNFIEVDARSDVQSAIASVREYAQLHKRAPVVLLRTTKGIENVSSRALISNAGRTPLATVAKEVPAIPHGADRENVFDLMERENTDLACVVDEHGKILGIIQLSDILSVAEKEATEDVYRMGAVDPISTSYLHSNFRTIWRKRVVWLSILFIAELFTFTALASFESSIASITALALFVPLCISTGGNSGSQAATLITRAMALGDVSPRDWWKILRRELLMGIALGTVLGVVAFVRASLTPQHILGDVNRWMLGLVIAVSVSAICLWGTLVGSMLPLVFMRFRIDPGYASSPFVATFVDVTGIVIYFSIANFLIL